MDFNLLPSCFNVCLAHSARTRVPMSMNSCGVHRVLRLFTVPERAKRRIGQITDCTVRKHSASFAVGGFLALASGSR
jgi:hypothetical protein